MRMLNKIFFYTFTPFFYIFWVLISIIKHIALLFYIPFETQKFVNTYIAFYKNSESVFNAIFDDDQQDDNNGEETKPETETKDKTVGFKCFPSVSPGFPSPGHIEDEDEEI